MKKGAFLSSSFLRGHPDEIYSTAVCLPHPTLLTFHRRESLLSCLQCNVSGSLAFPYVCMIAILQCFIILPGQQTRTVVSNPVLSGETHQHSWSLPSGSLGYSQGSTFCGRIGRFGLKLFLHQFLWTFFVLICNLAVDLQKPL